MSKFRFSSPRPRFGLKPYALILALGACGPMELPQATHLVATASGHDSAEFFERVGHAVLGFAQPFISQNSPAVDQEATGVAPRVVFNLRSSKRFSNGTVRMRRAIEPGESIVVKLGKGETMQVLTSPRAEGRLFVELEYVHSIDGAIETQEYEFILPGAVEWTPNQDGPSFDLRFRRHRPIKLILDGDPLTWMMGGDWETRNSWRRS